MTSKSGLSKGISILIATYNGEKVLPATLESLLAQNRSCAIEVIVVNNLSTDSTNSILADWKPKFASASIPFVIEEESTPGKTFAQETGIAIAKHDYVLICDDDNCLFPDYIQKAFDYMEANSKAGALGGIGIIHPTNSAPEWLPKYKEMFALGPQSSIEGNITLKKKYVNGAGCVIRREAWKKIKESGAERILNSERSKIRTSGEDNEMCYLLVAAGYEIHYSSNLKFHHNLLSDRFSIENMVKLRLGYIASFETIKSYVNFLKVGKSRSQIDVIKDFFISLIRLSVLVLITPFQSKNLNHRLRLATHQGILSETARNFFNYPELRKKIRNNIELARSTRS